MVNGIEDPLHSGFVVARDDAPFLAGVGPSFLKPEAVSSGVHPSLAKEWPAAAAFGLAAACVVSPILGTSFLGDDAFNSYVDGWIAAHHSTLAGAFAAYFREWDIGRGRFIPLLQILNILQFHAFHQPYPLKLLQTIAIGFDVATLYAVVRTFGASAARSALACVVAVLSLQIRYAYDPISQYNLHLPLSTEAALLTLFFAARYARDARGRDLAAAVSCFAVATLFYEIFAPLALSIPFVLRRSGSPWRPLLVASAPFSAIVLLEGLIVGVVRHVSPQPAGTAYAPTLMGAYVATLARQLAGTLPFSYPVFDPQAVFRAAQPFWFLRPSLGACVANRRGPSRRLELRSSRACGRWRRSLRRPSGARFSIAFLSTDDRTRRSIHSGVRAKLRFGAHRGIAAIAGVLGGPRSSLEALLRDYLRGRSVRFDHGEYVLGESL
jgi:hypothetical protein